VAIAIRIIGKAIPFSIRNARFNFDFVANWIEMKQKEYDALRLRPHPYEFAMYYDV
jgi:glutamine synthetase